MEDLNAYQIIEKKRDSHELTEQEITWFIHAVTHNQIMDYQISALLMAIYLNGMSVQETSALVKAMIESGQQLQLNDPAVVDKHSTGGVGDKTSFIVGPIAAACGVKVPMVAGKGLGHTGGTVDKANSIPGFNTSISLTEFVSLLKKNGIVLTGQTDEIAPADKKLYALRGVTATIDTIPLITASIMSKKLSEGIAGLVLDIKYGSGAFMKTIDEGHRLAHSIMETANCYGVKTMVFISNMNWPLGSTVGNSLEIMECIKTLQGKGPKDLEELSIQLAAGMIHLAGKAPSFKEGKMKARHALDNGMAMKKFEQLVRTQGGDPAIFSTPDRCLPLATERHRVKAKSEGYIGSFQNDQIGMMALEMGAGRKQKSDSIDFGVGLEFVKRPGDFITVGDTIFTFYHHPSQKELVQSLEYRFLQNMITIVKDPPKLGPLVADILVSEEQTFNTNTQHSMGKSSSQIAS